MNQKTPLLFLRISVMQKNWSDQKKKKQLNCKKIKKPSASPHDDERRKKKKKKIECRSSFLEFHTLFLVSSKGRDIVSKKGSNIENTVPDDLPYLKLLLALKAAALEPHASFPEDFPEVAFFFMLSLLYPKIFQNRRVSSAAAEATV